VSALVIKPNRKRGFGVDGGIELHDHNLRLSLILAGQFETYWLKNVSVYLLKKQCIIYHYYYAVSIYCYHLASFGQCLYLAVDRGILISSQLSAPKIKQLNKKLGKAEDEEGAEGNSIEVGECRSTLADPGMGGPGGRPH